MKVYSRSQGSIVDYQQPQTGGIDDNEKMVRALLGQAVLSGKASGSDVTALQGLGLLSSPPTTEERKATEEKRKLGESFKSGQSQLGYLSQLLGEYEGKNVSGLFPSLKAKFGKGISKEGMFGGLAPSQETNILQSAISDYNTRLFDIAGKAFTGPERDILEGLVLDIGDDEARLKDKIAQANRLIINKGSELGFNLPEMGGTQNQSLSTNVTQTGGGKPPTPQIPGEGILNFLIGRTMDYGKKAMAGELEQQKKPLDTQDILSMLAGPVGLAVPESVGGGGRGDIVRETMAPAAEIASYAVAPGLYKQLGGTKAGGILGGLMGGTSPEEQTLGQRGVSTAAGAGVGAVLGKLFETISNITGRGKAQQAIGQEVYKRTPIDRRGLLKELEEQTASLRQSPNVQKVYNQEIETLNKLVKEEGTLKSGKMLDSLLKRVYPLAKYDATATGKAKLESDFYKIYGKLLRDKITQVTPEVDPILKQLSSTKATTGKLDWLKNVIEQTLARAGAWRLISKI